MKTFIIAEAGINHEGDIDRAKMLVDAAVRCGADAVKFQTFIPETIALDDNDLANLRKYALPLDDFQELKDYCDRESIEFMSTPFCVRTAQLLQDIGVKRFKISSGNVTNMALIKKVASFRKDIILSLGMSTHEEKQQAITTLLGYGLKREQLTVMHCRSIYPTPEDKVSLGEIRKLLRYGVHVGYSDHSMSTLIPSYAVAVGATMIEKHFTLWPREQGADHAMSIDPLAFEEMITNIRFAETICKVGPAIADEEKELREVWLEKARRQNG